MRYGLLYFCVAVMLFSSPLAWSQVKQCGIAPVSSGELRFDGKRYTSVRPAVFLLTVTLPPKETLILSFLDDPTSLGQWAIRKHTSSFYSQYKKSQNLKIKRSGRYEIEVFVEGELDEFATVGSYQLRVPVNCP